MTTTLNGLSCTSETNCVAIDTSGCGSYGEFLRAVWGGRAWAESLAALGFPNCGTECNVSINGVSCVGATDSTCFAVGSRYRALTSTAVTVEFSDGKRSPGSPVPARLRAGRRVGAACSTTATTTNRSPGVIAQKTNNRKLLDISSRAMSSSDHSRDDRSSAGGIV